MDAQEKIRRGKANFKRNLFLFIAVTALLWIIWAFTDKMDYESNLMAMWPVWPTLAWGLAVVIHYTVAYPGGVKRSE